MRTGQWGVGSTIADRYKLLEPLGEGGMGSVWRAEHLTLRSPVAIKMLNESIAENPEMLERFMREAQSAAALRSSHVVQIFDYGVEGGAPYIAMELLFGQSLADRLQRGPLSLAELSRLFSQVTKAISKAHQQGITHRDLKPDNIFIVEDGEDELAKVLDFGIAKISDNQVISGSTSNTRTGIILGTPHYMSPEQARGNRAVDFRCDLWALGVIAYECLTGQLPFQSNALGDLVLKICTTEAPAPSSLRALPAAFDAWFVRATGKEPDARFQSAKEMNEALQAALRGELASSAAFPTGDTRHGIGDAGRLRALDASSPSPAASARADDGLHDFVTGETQISNKTTARSVSVDVAVRATRNRRLGGLVLLLVVLGAMGMALLLVRHNATDAPLEQPSDSSPTLAAPPRAEASLPASPPPQANVPAPWASQLGPAERSAPVLVEPVPSPAEPPSGVSPPPPQASPRHDGRASSITPVPSPQPPTVPRPPTQSAPARRAAPRPAPAPAPLPTPAPAQRPERQAPSGDGLFSDRK